MLGTDAVTIYKKQRDGSFIRTWVDGVQWSDKDEVVNVDGRVHVTKYVSITFFDGTYQGLDLPKFTEEDAIFYGKINEEVVNGKISVLLRKYPKSGLIKSVADNSNRDYLKNIKVVLI